MMTDYSQCYRQVSIVMLDRDGNVAGQLPDFTIASPWLQEVAEITTAVQQQFDFAITILRLLSVDDSELPKRGVTYLAESSTALPDQLPKQVWPGRLEADTHRNFYAEAGGPNKALSWARESLRQHAQADLLNIRQIRTWNLSAIWRLETTAGVFWLKCIPDFFSHEGPVIALFKDEAVPKIIAQHDSMILMPDIPGLDCYDAEPDQISYMIRTLVDLQIRWHTHLPSLITTGIPRLTEARMTEDISAVVTRNLDQLDTTSNETLKQFSADLPDRLTKLSRCGLPDTLVHGDYHPGNWRGEKLQLTILDWGDCVIGHPLLDMPALLERTGPHQDTFKSEWLKCWQDQFPNADVEEAARLIHPIAIIRRAVVYQHFLDHIEESERIYHSDDPAECLLEAAAYLQMEGDQDT